MLNNHYLVDTVVIFILVTVIVVAFFLNKYLKKRKKEILYSMEEFEKAIEEYRAIFSHDIYVTHSILEYWRVKYEHLSVRISNRSTFVLSTELKRVMVEFKQCFENAEIFRKYFNNDFVEREKVTFKSFFDSVLKDPLNEQQREAILHDEDNSLVIAGAGTGKTTTIMGKIAYLLEKGLATEEEVLLIAYGKDAAKDMRNEWDEINKKLNKKHDVTIKTFHALGYDMIGEIEDNKPNLAFGDPKTAEEKAKDFLMEALYDKELDKNIRVLVASFFLYYIFPEPDIKSFNTLDEYISYVKSIKLITFQGEIVKSYEELQIANFLYLNNITYFYEKVFDENIKNAKFTAYKPDFYLPEYNISIEHWGIDEKGRVPKYFSSENAIDASEKYRSKMDYARKIHKDYDRILVETYSYETKKDLLLPNLNKKLKNEGVAMKQRPLEEILSKIKVGKTFQPFINLMYTFIVLAKSNDVSANYLREITEKDGSKRVKTFIEIFSYLFNEYEAYLKKHNEIDFSDMINRAKDHVLQGRYQHKYKYILVDEFQDMSIGRYKFLKALLDQMSETKLFCVGDDWQSIYRFSGSDISITTTFSEYFGYTHKAKLESTHRFNNKILDYTSVFIQKNPAQIKKNLKTDFIVNDDYLALDIRTYSGNGGAKAERSDLLVDILEEIKNRILIEPLKRTKDGPKVLILGRYRHDRPENITKLQQKYKEYFILEFKTAHKSKGSTYAYTILMDVNAGLLGFPSEIEDDPLLQLVLHKGDSFKNAEERRLFYVALTRAIKANYIITQEGKESCFVKELQKLTFKTHGEKKVNKCPQCRGGDLVLRQGSRGPFYGCNNYPHCDYTCPSIKVESATNQ